MLRELRYNFLMKEACIKIPFAVENASEIADAINKFFFVAAVDCIGYDHQPKPSMTTFYFYVESATLLDTLVSVFDKYMNYYEQ